MSEKRNIILIGMPACGKSVTGVVLAKALKKKFIDVDLLIQERAGKGLQDIINEDGLDEFKRMEEDVLLSITEENAVIATGGSAVYYDKAMKHLKDSGIVLYIDVPFADIMKRLSNIRTRGVAMAKGQTLDDIYAIRKPLYEKYADVTVCSGNGSDMEETVAAIIDAVSIMNR